MAVSDKKYKKYRSRTHNFEAGDRTHSKRIYDNIIGSGDPVKFLDGLGDDEFLTTYNVLSCIKRYGSTDWERIAGKIGKGNVQRMEQRVHDVKVKHNRESAERYETRHAKRMVVLQEQTEHFRRNVSLTVGMLRSDVHQAVSMTEKYGLRCGDWLDDPVAAYTSGVGFAEEVKQSAGIKLQITLSLDWSNSMWYNDIAAASIEAYIILGMALDELQQMNPGSVYTQSFIFARGEDGKNAANMDDIDWYVNVPDEVALGRYDALRNCMSQFPPHGAGQDTWIAPLFDNIEAWEREKSDDGAVRLDIVLTDGVLEHPVDVRNASEIQERRDGTLQTILLNFLPENEWQDTTLPLRCIQYPANVDNISGLLRQILGEFLSVYV